VSRIRVAALLLALLLSIAVVGCGGDDELAPEVPGDPVEMPLPRADEPPGGDTGEQPADEEADLGTEDATAEPNGTATDPGAGTDSGESTPPPPAEETGEAPAAEPDTAAPPEETAGGTTAPPAEADGPANDTAPPPGSNAEQFEDFCAQNPGAC
jgi:hypothetical protein